VRRSLRIPLELAVVVGIAALVRYVPGSGHATRALEAALSAAFAGALIWTFGRAYKVRRWALLSLPERVRGELYFALAGFVLLLAGASRLWRTAAGEFGFWVGIGLVVYLLFAFYRQARRY
jgi:xanthine/uracil/vitamin C permease (AzgA family)